MIEKRRETKETQIDLMLHPYGARNIAIDTGHPFFDHLLHQLAYHAGWDFELKAEGDLEVDDHHLVEDTALTLGAALQDAWRGLGNRRYGQRLLPMDDALVLCAVDLGGRPYCVLELGLTREMVGGLATEMIPHFFHSLAMAGAFTLHLRKITGENHHHLIEASFKALAQALGEALTPVEGHASTKGSL